MRCERCGAPIVNKFIRVNGVLLCEKCARDFNVEDPFRGSMATLLNQPFSVLGEITNALMTGGNELDFANANTKIRCPKCGTTLKDVETNGTVGCIECYNTFNETILKDILNDLRRSRRRSNLRNSSNNTTRNNHISFLLNN